MRSLPVRALPGRGPVPALWAALLCALGLVATGAVALLVPAAHAHDAGALQGFVDLNRPLVTRLADGAAHSVDALPYALAAVVLVVIALARRKPRLALVVAAALALSVLSCEGFKAMLSGIRHTQWFGPSPVGRASWPSGHAAAAMSLALCAVLVAPRRLRPWVAAAGSAAAIAVSFSILILAWHLPSDVLGGFLMAALWVALAVAALRAGAPARREQRPRASARASMASRFSLAALVPAGAGAAALSLALLLRGDAVASFASDHLSFVIGALVIAATAWSLSSGLALVLRR